MISGNVRLMHDGVSKSRGRLEIFYKGIWGTVCDRQFDFLDAPVVCRMLGFKRGTEATFGPGDGPIWLEGIYCRSSEKSLFDCDADPFGVTDCSHDEDVGVSCAGRSLCRSAWVI